MADQGRAENADVALELSDAWFDAIAAEIHPWDTAQAGMAVTATIRHLLALPVEQRMEAMGMKPWPDGVTHHERCWIEVRRG